MFANYYWLTFYNKFINKLNCKCEQQNCARFMATLFHGVLHSDVSRSLLAQSHNAIRFQGVLCIKTVAVTLGTVSCFSELDIHCLNANTPPQKMSLCGIVQVVNEECESLYKKQVRPFWDSGKLSFHFTILILKIYPRDIKLFCFCFVFFLHAFPGHPTKPKVKL